MSDDTVIYAVKEVVAETTSARLLDIDGDKVWVPKSQSKMITTLEAEKVEMPKWLAKKLFPNEPI